MPDKDQDAVDGRDARRRELEKLIKHPYITRQGLDRERRDGKGEELGPGEARRPE
jgi:hypothetical protein